MAYVWWRPRLRWHPPRIPQSPTASPRWAGGLIDAPEPRGAPSRAWTAAGRTQLKTVPASAFEAVDDSACMVDVNSAQASCP